MRAITDDAARSAPALLALAVFAGCGRPDDAPSPATRSAGVQAADTAQVPRPAEEGDPRATSSAPRLALAPGVADVHDFGRVVEGDKLTHVFALEASGGPELVISGLKTTCKCTRTRIFHLVGGERVLTALDEPIPAPTQLELEVDVSSHQRLGEWRSTAIVSSNDPGGPLKVSLTASVDGVFRFERGRNLSFAEMTPDETREGTLRIASDHLEPYALRVDSERTAPELRVTLAPVAPDAEGRASAWDVHVELGPGVSAGWRTFPVYVVTDVPVPWPKIPSRHGEKKLFEILFYANVQVNDVLRVNPGLLSFGRVPRGGSAERRVVVRCLDDFALSAVRPAVGAAGAALAPALAWEVRALEGRNAVELTVRFTPTPETPAGSFDGVLELETGHPRKATVNLRFVGVCE